MKPLIALFKTPNGYYLFDACKDEIIPIKDTSFEHLRCQYLDKGKPSSTIPHELMELKLNGYLSEERAVSEVRHIYSDYLEVFLERKLSMITLQLTQNCNFRCKYCIYSEDHSLRQRSHTNKNMSKDTAKKAIEFLRAHAVDSPKVNIGFYGGEPLLEFSLLKEIVTYSKNCFVGKNLTYSLTTNGTLLTDEVIHFCDDHDVSLMISLDGPKEINDINRVFADGAGTFDSVIERVNRLREIAPHYAQKLQISMVIDPKNDFDCINEICMDDDALRKLNIQPSLVEREYGDEKTTYSEEYICKLEYQRFLAILAYYGRYSETRVSPIAENWLVRVINDCSRICKLSSLRKEDAPSGPCIPGKLRLFVNVDGDLFPCERVSEKSSAMCIGSVDSGFDLNRAYEILNIGALTETECKECWCFRYCISCAKKADDITGHLSASSKLSFCGDILAETYAKIQQYLVFTEIPQFYAYQFRRKEENA